MTWMDENLHRHEEFVTLQVFQLCIQCVIYMYVNDTSIIITIIIILHQGGENPFTTRTSLRAPFGGSVKNLKQGREKKGKIHKTGPCL